MRAHGVVLLAMAALAAACGDDASGTPDAPILGDAATDGDGSLEPRDNPTREVVDTALALDVTARRGTATITLGASEQSGAGFEVGGLAIAGVTRDGVAVPFRVLNRRLELGLPASSEPLTVVISYSYMLREGFEGQSENGYTLIWPYFCQNLFPCHSDPADGTTFTVALSGVPAGQTAVYPTTITEAPAYQVAWSIDDYTEVSLGTTTAGTEIVVWHLPGEADVAADGTAHLVEAFEWLETTLGPYRFGPKAGAVSVAWGPGALGGMEHHPFWHTGSGALDSVETNVHEAAHGWYGGGIRIGCWEDFVLSEGTTSYLAARALDVVASAQGASVWQGYTNELRTMSGALKVWPQTCGEIDVIADNLFTRAPYVRGAFFYRALALRLGAEVVDGILAAFYVEHAGEAARMSDMLALVQDMTGYDPTACAATWLTASVRPTPGACP